MTLLSQEKQLGRGAVHCTKPLKKREDATAFNALLKVLRLHTRSITQTENGLKSISMITHLEILMFPASFYLQWKRKKGHKNFQNNLLSMPRCYHVFLGQITHYWGGFPTPKAEESLIFGRNAQITCNSFIEKHCLIIFTWVFMFCFEFSVSNFDLHVVHP